MGHLKLAPPFNVVVSPRVAPKRDAPRARDAEDARAEDARAEDAREDARVAEIAQRFAPSAFAPGAHIIADQSAPPGPSPDLPQDGAAGAFKALPQSFQGLILALILIALLPSLTLTALIWFGPAKLPGFSSGAAGKTALIKPGKTVPIKTASLVDLPFGGASEPAPAAAPDRIAAAETGETGQASLAAPAALEAEAGQAVPFAIALASVEPLPSRSVIAVTGLPLGATLSAGRPYMGGEWNLRADELSGLRLYLPETAQGETVLEIALIAADGATLAETRTALKVTAATPSADAANVAAALPGPAPASPSHAALGPGFDPFTAPAAGDAAAPVPADPVPASVEAQAPEAQAPETQATEAETAATEAATVEADAVEDAAASGEAASSEAASGSTEDAAASETASETTSEPASGEAASGEPIKDPTSPESGPFADTGAQPEASVALSDFVNLRARPTSSARVIAVMAKGAKVTPKAKRRGWLKVTDAASGKTGWIYGRYAGGSAQGASSASPSRLGAGATADDESLLSRFGHWLIN